MRIVGKDYIGVPYALFQFRNVSLGSKRFLSFNMQSLYLEHHRMVYPNLRKSDFLLPSR